MAGMKTKRFLSRTRYRVREGDSPGSRT